MARLRLVPFVIFIPPIIVSFIILVIITFNSFNLKENISMSPIHLRILGIFGLLFYISSITIYFYAEISIQSSTLDGISYEISCILWIIANVLSYINFSERLRTTLKNTAFRTKSCNFIILYVMLISYIICETFLNIHLQNEDLTKIFTIVNFTVYMLLSIILCYLFIKKLMLLTVAVAEDLNVKSMANTPHKISAVHQVNHTPVKWNFSMSAITFATPSINEMNVNESGMSELQQSYKSNTEQTQPLKEDKEHVPPSHDPHHLNPNHITQGIKMISKTSTFHRLSMLHLSGQTTQWLNTITKLTILSLWTLIITDIWLGYEMIVYELLWICDDDKCQDVLHTISGILMALDSIINCTMIYLSFQFGHRTYINLCKTCDSCCNRCCIRFTRRKKIKKWTEGNLNEAVDTFVTDQLEYGDDGYAELGILN